MPSAEKRKNRALVKEVVVTLSVALADLVAALKRADADAAHKLGLIKAAANKGPKAIATAVETAAKAAKRRDSIAKKLADLEAELKD